MKPKGKREEQAMESLTAALDKLGAKNDRGTKKDKRAKKIAIKKAKNAR